MDFISKLATATPLPAGGAAAAYTIGLAAALLEKVVLLEVHRHADRPEVERDLLAARKEVEQMRATVEGLVERDPNAYRRFAGDRATADPASAEQSFDDLIDVGMKTVKNGLLAIQWARQLSSLTIGRTRAHLLVACELIIGGVNASGHLIRVNIAELARESRRNRCLKRLDELLHDCQRQYEQVRKHL